MIEVTLYSKEDCHLCHDVKEVLLSVQSVIPFIFREVGITSDPLLLDQFKEEIPVIFINGRKAFKYRVERNALIRRLEREQ
ncbi:MAG: glutaredoxin family protein [Candidatus Tectomicrobia bacterium]|nr:glutaredoxin family protein [Candidatus Tectomicrobia bacterium]